MRSSISTFLKIRISEIASHSNLYHIFLSNLTHVEFMIGIYGAQKGITFDQYDLMKFKKFAFEKNSKRIEIGNLDTH